MRTAALTLLWTLNPISQAADLYGTTGRGSTPSVLYKIDRATGAETLVGSVLVGGTDDVTVDGLAWDNKNAVMLAHTSDISATHPNSLIEVSLVDGRATLLSETDISDATGLCVDSKGQPYSWWEEQIAGFPQNDLLKLNKVTGDANKVGESGISSPENFGMAFDRTNDTKIHFINGDGKYWLLNTATGLGTFQNIEVNWSFFGKEGDIDPDAPALTYWSVEYQRASAGTLVNTRLQKFVLPAGTALGTPVQTNLNDLEAIAFTAKARPPRPADCPECTTWYGASGRTLKKNFFGQCFDKCSLIPGLKLSSLNWECGPC
jgi:hypothetical protein